MIHKFFVAFIPIFVAIDPIGLVAVFMGLAGSASREERQRQGFVGIFTALCISVGFMFLGKIIFVALGITVADFQVDVRKCQHRVYQEGSRGRRNPETATGKETRP